MANLEVKASPAKAFFVEMITRDIELQDAILDLLDNCVDGIKRTAKRAEGPKAYKGYYAHINFNKTSFTIEDNCGGISWQTAETYAFAMGKHDAKADQNETIGVYGIGMKRAIFKMGKECVVHSHHKKSTFEVYIEPSWLKDDAKWTLPARNVKPRLKHFGTRIEITDLNGGISAEFEDGTHFRKNFIETVSRHYSFIIAKGFTVTVNGEEATSDQINLLWMAPGKEPEDRVKIRPYIYRSEINGVKVFMAVGFLRAPLTEAEADDESLRFSSDRAGWTVVCNDRVVLAYDKGLQTGWGTGGVPRYHTQFICIGGVVEFTSDKPIKLPMTTTKRGINASNEVFIKVKDRMQEAIKRFVSFTNDWKGSKDKAPFFGGCTSMSYPAIKGVSKKLALRALPNNSDERQYAPKLPAREKEITEKRISYVRSVEQIETLAQYLFDRKDVRPAEVGGECFDRMLNEISK